jgi:hypothetical protein
VPDDFAISSYRSEDNHRRGQYLAFNFDWFISIGDFNGGRFEWADPSSQQRDWKSGPLGERLASYSGISLLAVYWSMNSFGITNIRGKGSESTIRIEKFGILNTL